jgi:hypothetical protein
MGALRSGIEEGGECPISNSQYPRLKSGEYWLSFSAASAASVFKKGIKHEGSRDSRENKVPVEIS